MALPSFKVALTTLSFVLALSGCKKEKKTLKTTEVSFKKEGILKLYKAGTDSVIKQLDIEIAETDYETQTGLMYRNSMTNNQGMLFIFSDSKPRSFYMKNTRIPLDIIYIDNKNHLVSSQKNAKPFDETSLPSNVPAQFVLEVNAGLADEWNLKIGDSMSFNRE
ncbi:DUF192 domain-containing protein [Mangrovimonas aestuarii]|uniref:DUF192 domain-containing protein n=1 Tax=Mangrovimonas aestuarii TaxID=3018443 RepID=UPI002379218D|nr:DUF192 domain-containing protein [Mangrovimonas aestuarii]